MPGPVLDYRFDDLPALLPIFPLSGVLLLPRGRLPLNIFEPRYLCMIDDALKGHRLIGMIQPDPAEAIRSSREAPIVYSTGCAGRITSLNETADGRYLITLGGICRFQIAEELLVTTPYRQIRADFSRYRADLDAPGEGDGGVDREHLLAALRRYLDLHKMAADWNAIENAASEGLVNSLGMVCPFEPQEKQALLEAPDLAQRAKVLIALIELASAQAYGGPKPPLQ